MKYLVTGGAGFIGSALATKLINRGDEVVIIDNLRTGFKQNLPVGCVFLEETVCSVLDSGALDSHSFDGIFHISGQSSGEISYENPIYDLKSNTESTLKLLIYAKKNKCPKFLFASTMSVYGAVADKPINEDLPPNPVSLYAVGKLASENYMRIFSSFGIQCTALRLFNVYGPGQNLSNLKQGMISIYLAQAMKKNEIIVKGSKDRFRDMVYIDDVVDAFLACLKDDENTFNLYNVSTGVRSTVEQVIQLIKRYFPKSLTVSYSGSTPGDLFGIYGANDKITRDTGWRPKVSLVTGLDKMLKSITEVSNVGDC